MLLVVRLVLRLLLADRQELVLGGGTGFDLGVLGGSGGAATAALPAAAAAGPDPVVIDKLLEATAVPAVKLANVFDRVVPVAGPDGQEGLERAQGSLTADAFVSRLPLPTGLAGMLDADCPL